jgi:putative SOS response-associated peptidase YedK
LRGRRTDRNRRCRHDKLWRNCFARYAQNSALGRYRRTTAEEEIARQYHIPIPPQLDLPISYDIAQTQDVLAIRRHPETGERTLDALRSGLIPNWAKDEKIAYKTINARVETVDTAPSYRQAFKKRRCLIPADGFYEWRKVLGGKIPYNIQMKDGRPFAFASFGKVGNRPRPKNGFGPARLSPASRMNWYARFSLECR